MEQCNKCGGLYSVSRIGPVVPGGKEREEVNCPHCDDLKFSEMTSQCFLVCKATDEEVSSWAEMKQSSGKPMLRVVVFGDLSSDRASEQYPTITICPECFEANEHAEDDPIVSVDGVGQGACEWCGAGPT
ncbi:hypothetical protein SAMN05444141_11145 [Pseudovibrio denitrificans]|uniref:Uncharacterized protein n=1 Tax=Pseudovibrio denitrificans TaxID=258256 RepID=A0A1I7DV22_9HYPH|nr:hypothetical protein [Pseudovibrio denitrificans]SFU15537.1 hypothetical protein SAMN05444141_11145 [Pseudovibrio denitrificans]